MSLRKAVVTGQRPAFPSHQDLSDPQAGVPSPRPSQDYGPTADALRSSLRRDAPEDDDDVPPPPPAPQPVRLSSAGDQDMFEKKYDGV